MLISAGANIEAMRVVGTGWMCVVCFCVCIYEMRNSDKQSMQ